MHFEAFGNGCKDCDGFGNARMYDPPPCGEGGPVWIRVRCTTCR